MARRAIPFATVVTTKRCTPPGSSPGGASWNPASQRQQQCRSGQRIDEQTLVNCPYAAGVADDSKNRSLLSPRTNTAR